MSSTPPDHPATYSITLAHFEQCHPSADPGFPIKSKYLLNASE